jgi:prepilin-type N-terminal cleavage/methylation domain-containing protein
MVARAKHRDFSESGFSLIELMVVVAIISIISATAVNVVNYEMTVVRNRRRIADIQTLGEAFLAQTAGNENIWPDSTNPAGGNIACVSQSCQFNASNTVVAAPAVDAFLAPQLSQKPDDPRDGIRKIGGVQLWGYGYRRITAPVTTGGTVFPAGYYLVYTLEPPYKDMACGPGGMADVWANNATYILCYQQLNTAT